MMPRPEGFQETEHTADWELHVWARSLSGLFEQAARGMYSLSGVRLADYPGESPISERLDLEAPDIETLLVSFLSELLMYGEQQGVAFDEFDLVVEEHNLAGTLSGSEIASQEKEIKAVTFHHLKIRGMDGGFQVNIVFDV